MKRVYSAVLKASFKKVSKANESVKAEFIQTNNELRKQPEQTNNLYLELDDLKQYTWTTPGSRGVGYCHIWAIEVNKGLTGLTRLPLFRDVSVCDL